MRDKIFSRAGHGLNRGANFDKSGGGISGGKCTAGSANGSNADWQSEVGGTLGNDADEAASNSFLSATGDSESKNWGCAAPKWAEGEPSLISSESSSPTAARWLRGVRGDGGGGCVPTPAASLPPESATAGACRGESESN